jgi:phage host-nuclease inhibitor protein Gam
MGELLEHDLPEDESNQSEGFKVTDDYKADWALRKYRSYQERIELNESLAEKERKRIEDWLSSENEKLKQKQSFFENHLIAYAIGERDNNDRKTISLPNGTISTRQGSDSTTIEDKESILGWLKENNHSDVIKVKEELDLTEFKKQIVIDGEKVIWKDTGEIVQGVSVKNGKLSLKIVT